MDAVHIVGMGGIGCAVGHALVRAGAPVTFVEANPDKIAWARQHGVRCDRLSPVRADVTAFDGWGPPPGAVVLLCTKTYHNAAVLKRLRPDNALVPIQNGFDPALEAFTPRVEGIASFVAQCPPATAHVRITRPGQLHLGPHGARLPLLDRLAAALGRGAFSLEVVDDILPRKHTKLLYNAAISPLAASAGLDNGELLRRPRLRRLFFALLRENLAVLKSAGVPLARVGPFHPDTVQTILSTGWLASALACFFYPGLRGTYCSMAGDLPHGPTETDHYNGHLVRLARDFPCPLNRAVLGLVGDIVTNRRALSVARVEALASLAN